MPMALATYALRAESPLSAESHFPAKLTFHCLMCADTKRMVRRNVVCKMAKVLLPPFSYPTRPNVVKVGVANLTKHCLLISPKDPKHCQAVGQCLQNACSFGPEVSCFRICPRYLLHSNPDGPWFGHAPQRHCLTCHRTSNIASSFVKTNFVSILWHSARPHSAGRVPWLSRMTNGRTGSASSFPHHLWAGPAPPFSAWLNHLCVARLLCIRAPESTTNSLPSGSFVDAAGRTHSSAGEQNVALPFSLRLVSSCETQPNCGTIFTSHCILVGRRSLFWVRKWSHLFRLFVGLFVNLMMQEQTRISCLTSRFVFIELTFGKMPILTKRSRAHTFQIVSTRLSKNDTKNTCALDIFFDTLRPREKDGSEGVAALWSGFVVHDLYSHVGKHSSPFRTLAFFFPLVTGIFSSFNAIHSFSTLDHYSCFNFPVPGVKVAQSWFLIHTPFHHCLQFL